MPLFNLIETDFCNAILIEEWNAPAHRYFIAYHARGDYKHVLGLPVIDEFATFSSPIFITNPAWLGKIYNAGLSLCGKRNPDSDIDGGWPPLCVGAEGFKTDLPADYETKLIAAIEAGKGSSRPEPRKVEDHNFDSIQIGQIQVIATDAPLLPTQLHRICQNSNAPFSLAFSTANRLTRQKNGQPIPISAVSEKILSEILKALS